MLVFLADKIPFRLLLSNSNLKSPKDISVCFCAIYSINHKDNENPGLRTSNDFIPDSPGAILYDIFWSK